MPKCIIDIQQWLIRMAKHQQNIRKTSEKHQSIIRQQQGQDVAGK